MLDTDTKSRIDSARDILVGKVPDPKSQVEQITIALIYKFMDDMDRQSEELGGKPSFFTGQFRKYRWSSLLDKRFGGHERLLLYAEGIERMNENRNTPQLFRDIFKGVFLPYRDPETLNLFLKEIDGFSYDHSERLGDAYEYLLSVLGTQGDAGQFRTPRHIIDFIVAVVDPRKDETVLDPACGTAGFLISAYKHIVNAVSRQVPGRGEAPAATDELTPDERARLMTNFRGYDIAPDMVRLSRVNMYLHGFPQPTIHEYDTLTSEERWDERYDVIMANPPFMTPQGGIRPHNRFSIKANRSEVLFVDYIAEHLNPGGRAGVIVPEGIVFQGQNAYKALRRMLVENYLWAIVSLPAGVFNPYSGVKTSILFLDRNLARRTDTVLFVKVENDGFDLGAQRRPIEKNDLPDALKALLAWKNGQREAQEAQGEVAHAVSRKRLLESPDVSFSGDRYRTVEVRTGKWPVVKLAEVCEQHRKIVEPNSKQAAKLPYLGLEDVESDTGRILKMPTQQDSETGKSTSFAFDNRHVLYGKLRPYLNKVALPEFSGRCTTEFIPPLPNERLDRHFLGHILRSPQTVARAMQGKTGSRMPRADMDALLSFEIPLPPLAEQERLVAELEGYRKVIEAARQILAHYKPNLCVDPQWPTAKIGDVCKRLQYGLSQKLNTKGVGYRTFRMNELVEGRAVDNGQMKRVEISRTEFEKYQLEPGDLLFNRTNSYEHVGRTGIFLLDGEYTFASYLVRLAVDKKQVEPEFLNAYMNTAAFQQAVKQYASRAIGQANISASSLAQATIPVPPLKTQRQIVAELESARALVEGNRELIARMEKRMQAKLAEIWGEPPEVSA